MIRRFFCLALAALIATPGFALEPAAPAPPPPAPTYKVQRVALETTAGRIVIAVEIERAPITGANFLRYVDQKRLDGTSFYRATKIGEGYGLVQGGARNEPKKLFPPIAHEPTTVTGLSHVDGAISMARAEPGSATADFFITIGDLVSMDADPKATGDNLGFAVFGRVVEGMDVIHAILKSPTSPTDGVGVMKGQMLSPTITITTARRVD